MKYLFFYPLIGLLIMILFRWNKGFTPSIMGPFIFLWPAILFVRITNLLARSLNNIFGHESHWR